MLCSESSALEVLLYGGGQYYQYNEDDFLLKFLLLTSFFRITNLQVIKEKLLNLTAPCCFHVFVYECYLKARYKSNLK